MVKIISQGKLHEYAVYTKCSKCGCKFFATKDEFKKGIFRNEVYYIVSCPCCSSDLYYSWDYISDNYREIK
jgi:hypothetical protein